MLNAIARPFVLLTLGVISQQAPAATSVERAQFGTLPDGRKVEAVTLRGEKGISATLINYGAALQSLMLPDRNGELADVTLGYASLDGYLAKPEYFGATVGRFANRLAHGRFELDGKRYQTPQNNNGHALHGGDRGFDKVLWEITRVDDGPRPGVTFRYVSADGEQGYPGELTVLATYVLDGSELSIVYEATTKAPTIVNITNHAYWNLAGEGAAAGAMGHVLTIPAASYTPVDAGLIPTGEFRPVDDTPFDFRKPTVVGARVRDNDPQLVIARGYDHNFVVARDVAREPRLMARVEEPVSGRGFELWSNQPGVQFYSGNFLDATVVGKAGRMYREGDAIVLEPQIFPDTPNHAAFGSARLAPGERYRNVIIYRFTGLSR